MSKLDIALASDELDAFLASERTARLATSGRSGPHAVPLWFVWLEGSLFMNTTLGNLTVVNLADDRRGAATVDDGFDYATFRGVVLRGLVTTAPADPRLDEVREAWSNKYLNGNPVPFDAWKNRVWLRLDPSEVASWDFRKIPAARARRDAERAARS